jgi:hypothetical protein
VISDKVSTTTHFSLQDCRIINTASSEKHYRSATKKNLNEFAAQVSLEILLSMKTAMWWWRGSSGRGGSSRGRGEQTPATGRPPGYYADCLLGEKLGVTGHNLHLADLLRSLLVLEGRIRQDERPHVVAEPVGVQMALGQRNKNQI